MDQEIINILHELNAQVLEYQNSKNIIIIDDEGYKYKGQAYYIRTKKKLPHRFRKNPFVIENIKNYLNVNNSTLELISTEYIDIKTNLKFRCKIHNDKIQLHTLDTILRNNGGCKFCNKEKQIEKMAVNEDVIIKRCNELGLIYLRREISNGTDVYYKCPKHLDKGIQKIAWYHLKTCTYGCRYCAGKDKTTEDFKKEIYEKQPNIIILNDYISSETKDRIFYKCKICNKEWDTCVASLRGGSGCPECAKRIRGEKRRKTHKDFVEELHRVQPNLIPLSKYQGTHKLVKILCTIHNNEFDSYPANLLNNSAHCPICTRERISSLPSKGEQRIQSYLDNKKIEYDPEHTFDDCKNIKLLPFDFFLCDLNIVIEFDGEQHYRPIELFGGEEQFKRRQINDAIKTKYCNENHIKLIRIPYWEYDNIENILDSEIPESFLM